MNTADEQMTPFQRVWGGLATTAIAVKAADVDILTIGVWARENQVLDRQETYCHLLRDGLVDLRGVTTVATATGRRLAAQIRAVLESAA